MIKWYIQHSYKQTPSYRFTILLKYCFLSASVDQHFKEEKRSVIKNKHLGHRQKNKYFGKCFRQNVTYMQSKKLCEVINKMDCQLNQLCLNCPIHNLIC